MVVNNVTPAILHEILEIRYVILEIHYVSLAIHDDAFVYL
jgi:hypothetical protein